MAMSTSKVHTVRNFILQCFHTLKENHRYVEEGKSFTNYEAFWLQLNNGFSLVPNGYKPSNSSVEAFYRGTMSPDEFIIAVEEHVLMKSKDKMDTNLDPLLTISWDVYSSTYRRSNLCNKIPRLCGRQLWAIYNKLDIECCGFVHIEDIAELILKIYYANGREETAKNIFEWFCNQTNVDFWSFFSALIENHSDLLQTHIIQDLYEEIFHEIMKKGKMTKKGHKVQTWKERWFILTTEQLLYYESLENRILKGSIVINRNTKVNPLPSIKGRNYLFRVTDGISNRPYDISASDPQMLQDWVDMLQVIIAAKSESGRNILHRMCMARCKLFPHRITGLPSFQRGSIDYSHEAYPVVSPILKSQISDLSSNGHYNPMAAGHSLPNEITTSRPLPEPITTGQLLLNTMNTSNLSPDPIATGQPIADSMITSRSMPDPITTGLGLPDSTAIDLSLPGPDTTSQLSAIFVPPHPTPSTSQPLLDHIAIDQRIPSNLRTSSTVHPFSLESVVTSSKSSPSHPPITPRKSKEVIVSSLGELGPSTPQQPPLPSKEIPKKQGPPVAPYYNTSPSKVEHFSLDGYDYALVDKLTDTPSTSPICSTVQHEMNVPPKSPPKSPIQHVTAGGYDYALIDKIIEDNNTVQSSSLPHSHVSLGPVPKPRSTNTRLPKIQDIPNTLKEGYCSSYAQLSFGNNKPAETATSQAAKPLSMVAKKKFDYTEVVVPDTVAQDLDKALQLKAKKPPPAPPEKYDPRKRSTPALPTSQYDDNTSGPTPFPHSNEKRSLNFSNADYQNVPFSKPSIPETVTNGSDQSPPPPPVPRRMESNRGNDSLLHHVPTVPARSTKSTAPPLPPR